ncbi:MAG: hypothetical protein L0154_25450 [Chloroflexi bacterium]|nr:hypothetical protein [Chloroflexota bacterium]
MRKKKYVVGIVSKDMKGNVHVGAPGITARPQGYEAYVYQSILTETDYHICIPMALANDEDAEKKAVQEFILWIKQQEANESI